MEIRSPVLPNPPTEPVNFVLADPGTSPHSYSRGLCGHIFEPLSRHIARQLGLKYS